MRKQILLLEMYNLRMTLLENRLAFLKTNYLPRIAEYLQTDAIPADIVRRTHMSTEEPIEARAEKLLNYVAGFDPDSTKKNTQWLLNLLLKKVKGEGGQVSRLMRLEDLTGAGQLIGQFLTVKNQLPAEQRDLNRFKTPGDLAAALHAVTGGGELAPVLSQRQQDKAEEQAMYKETTVLYNDDQYRIVHPHTERAAVFFGKNTRWCTAAKNSNQFKHYDTDGPLYIILDKKNNRRWQFHFESNQFMDELDRQIDKADFCAQHPTIANFFVSREHDAENVGEINGYTISRTADAVIIRETGRRDSGVRGIMSDSYPAATLPIKDGHIFRGNLAVIQHSATGRRYSRPQHEPSFPLDIIEGGEEIEAIMNRIGLPVRFNIQKQLADWGVFGNESGQFGSLSDMGKRIMRAGDGLEWIGQDYGDGKFFALSDGHQEITYACLGSDIGEDHEVGLFEASAPSSDTERAALIKLVMATPEIKNFPEPQQDRRGKNVYFGSEDFDEATAAKIVEERPELADMIMLYKVKGPADPMVRQKLLQTLERAEIDVNPIWVGNSLV
ncbi:MAG: hypothetical protein EOO77_07610, partial [Oxalobacteraceae bacterium]